MCVRVPDVQQSWHSVPYALSRAARSAPQIRTMGQMWEMVLAKLNCIAGTSGCFATPFTPGEVLIEAAGRVPAMGREQMYSAVWLLV